MILFNKLYEKLKLFISHNWKALLVYIIVFVFMTYPLPYYIYTGGGTININDRVTIDGQSESKGSFNLAYVSELRATVPTLLLSYIIPSWESTSIETIKLTENETTEDIMTRDKIYLSDANQNAVKLAYEAAGKSFMIDGVKNHVVYIMDLADTSLRIGDILVSAEGEEIEDINTLKRLINSKEVGDKLSLNIIRDNNPIEAYLTIRLVDGVKLGGISLMKEISYQTNPTLTLSFSNNESGPSGGLLLAISIYDKLIDIDLTRGRKIVGTGTIDENGRVGSIGGVKYKLHGAVKSKADIFLVPIGENYDECIALKEKYHYDIEIIGVSTFSEAIMALEK